MKDPSRFISFIPHHADGSCNGLQHYAALGKDIDTGMHVNLLYRDEPGDVYSRVLDTVIDKISIASSNGEPIAKLLEGKLTRKIIKQTVMTFVYGVKLNGARRQIESQLNNIDSIPKEHINEASEYLSNITFQSMDSMFTSAREIMKWLTDCTRVLGRKGNPMAWNTPFGFPVEQPYRRSGKQLIQTSLQKLTLVSEELEDLPVLVQKQRDAFPPNFIHSLDSTHMLHTALQCHNNGLAFAAVHDSYWTHAATMDKMNILLRDSFIKLHETPILENLLQQLKHEYPDESFKDVPKNSNELNLQLVRLSPYFFH